MKITLFIRRKKSSSRTNDAENERTSNIYGEGAESRQDLGNGVPLVDMPNQPVNMGSVPERPTPYMHLGNAPAPPLYAAVQKNRPGNVVVQSKSSYTL